ncbi:hypothetical protein [Streptomyces longisporoflavus]|uniref:Transposase n=1 Tax=Streptomyces longisporoflavus TaxID=28044 RepID=A0ABW7R4S5_9ACTN
MDLVVGPPVGELIELLSAHAAMVLVDQGTGLIDTGQDEEDTVPGQPAPDVTHQAGRGEVGDGEALTRYNTRRRHSANGHLSPNEYERRHHTAKLTLAA